MPNHALFTWCLENGLGLAFQMTLMTVGRDNAPAGAFSPSHLHCSSKHVFP
jgi:hypothetical protein